MRNGILIACLILSLPSLASAQTSLLHWDLDGPIFSGNSQAPGAVASGVGSRNLEIAANVTPVFVTDAFMGGNFPTGSIDLTKFFEFGLTVDAGYQVTLSHLEFSLYGEYPGSGALTRGTYQVRSSDDWFHPIFTQFCSDVSGSGHTVTVDLSSLGTRIDDITFRIYSFNNQNGDIPGERGLRGVNAGGAGLTVYGIVEPITTVPLEVSGTFQHEDRLWDAQGFTGGVQIRPIRYADVRIWQETPGGDVFRGETSTDANGAFQVTVDAGVDADIYAEVLSSTWLHGNYPLEVASNSAGGGRTAFATTTFVDANTSLDVGTWLLEDTSSLAEAFNILDCGVDAFDWLAQPEANGAYPDLNQSQWLRFVWAWDGFWTSGYAPNLAYIASFQSGQSDGWDDSVILHELGHHVALYFHQDDSPGGVHYLSDNFQDPRLSYGEGYATYFVSEVREFAAATHGFADHVSVYADMTEAPSGAAGYLSFSMDIETGIFDDGTPIGNIGQASESSVAAALWDLHDGPTTPDDTAGDDDLIDDDGSDTWDVLLNYMKPLPDADVITFEDFVMGWKARHGSGYLAAELDDLLNVVNDLGFGPDAFEPDDDAASASPITISVLPALDPAGGIVINEIDLGWDAVELYNSSDTAIDVTGWDLVASTNALPAHAVYTFPSFVIPPGGFVYVWESGNPADGAGANLYAGVSISWINGGDGACELRDENDVAIDFVRWDGTSTPSTIPIPAGLTFTGSVNSPPFGQTLGRDTAGTDTDDASDFSGGLPSDAQPNGLPSDFRTLYDVGDLDVIALPLTANQRYTVRTSELFGAANTYLEILNPAGTVVLAANDDRGAQLVDSELTFVAPSTDAYLARVRQLSPVNEYGMYRIRAYQHQTNDLLTAPVSVAGTARNQAATGDVVYLTWLNTSLYDTVHLNVTGPSNLSESLPGFTNRRTVQLDQGVHDISVQGERAGQFTPLGEGWVYAGPVGTSYADGFEDASLADWGTGEGWGTSSTAQAGLLSATDSPGGDYANNVNSSLELRVPTSLGGAPQLSFWHICLTEEFYDFGFVEISDDHGVSWDVLAFYDSSDGAGWDDGVADPADWKQETFSLASYVGKEVRIRFRLQTDVSIAWDGWYVDDVSITSDPAVSTPGTPTLTYFLDQNHPNPFNPSTEIQFGVPQARKVTLRIFDVRGRLVKTLVDEPKAPGVYSVRWDGSDDTGTRVSSGIYHYLLEAGAYRQSRKLVLVE